VPGTGTQRETKKYRQVFETVQNDKLSLKFSGNALCQATDQWRSTDAIAGQIL